MQIDGLRCALALLCSPQTIANPRTHSLTPPIAALTLLVCACYSQGLNRIKRSLVTLDELAQPDKPAASAAGTTAGAGAGGGAGAGVGAKHTQSSSSYVTIPYRVRCAILCSDLTCAACGTVQSKNCGELSSLSRGGQAR